MYGEAKCPAYWEFVQLPLQSGAKWCLLSHAWLSGDPVETRSLPKRTSREFKIFGVARILEYPLRPFQNRVQLIDFNLVLIFFTIVVCKCIFIIFWWFILFLTSFNPHILPPYLYGTYYWSSMSGLILGLRSANDRRRYKAKPFLIGWAQT